MSWETGRMELQFTELGATVGKTGWGKDEETGFVPTKHEMVIRRHSSVEVLRQLDKGWS